MSKFKKDGSRPMPGVNTSSLPDIVFMLLFFFMVATTSKENDPTVKVESPVGTKTTELTPLHTQQAQRFNPFDSVQL